jgi:hypothetical protein
MAHPAPSSRLVSPELHCQHLRHKGMYVLTTPDPDGHRFTGGSYEATAYWCTCTQKAVGPDGNPASPTRCAMGGGRTCCN